MNEVIDKKSSRYLYPFTNCTACGPRYSIIKDLPYDRNNTTMSKFSMCPNCQQEYENVNSRRFHTEPNCCKKCGPKYTFIDLDKNFKDCENPIESVKKYLKLGKIVAIKGLGGFHLCCDALNEQAVALLREGKKRYDKPFAIMIRDIERAKKIAKISSKEEIMLTDKRRPILLLEKSEGFNLSEKIAPKQKRVGVMLPYMPLHYLLLDEQLCYLVMTSGNIKGKSIQYENDKAIKELRQITNLFLIHDRDIHIPVDDSVVRVAMDKEILSRPGRGYSPLNFHLNTKEDKEILSVGADIKSTFCLLKKGYITMSQYLGDINEYDNYKRYERIIKHILNAYKAEPEIIIHDFHPEYSSTQYAKSISARHLGVQHHHAHMVSCMVEHKLFKKVIGVIFDGTGFGIDGTVWGGEFFVGDRRGFKRVAHIKEVLLQGGDLTVEEPWRSAVAYLNSMEINPEKYLKNIDENHIAILQQALNKKFNCFKASSMGRLFDCVSALTGLCLKITYDGQGAIELENKIDEAVHEAYPYNISTIEEKWIISYEEIIKGVLKDLDNGIRTAEISAKFHNTIIDLTVEMIGIIHKETEIKDIVLSGGVFENNCLLNGIYKRLKSLNFNVYFNQLVPTNDNGISIGQIGIGQQLIKEE